jgi:hypothetical protein
VLPIISVILLALEIALISNGCSLLFPIGDSAVRVKGVIENGNDSGQCSVRLHLAKDDRLLDERRVDNVFLMTFVIAPSKMDYYFTVKCENSNNLFKSTVIELGDYKYYKNPIDFGEIRM